MENNKPNVYPHVSRNSDSKVIVLSGQGLTQIPSWALNENVEVLDVSNNNISHISSYISDCKNLKTLNLSGNNITSITSYISDRTNLTNLILDNNPNLSHLTDYLEDCTNLQLISVVNTKINYVPSFIKYKEGSLVFKY